MLKYYMGVPSPISIITSLSVMLALDACAVVLRFHARKRLKQAWQTDDWLTIPSLALAFALGANLFYGLSTNALGYPINSWENATNGVLTRKLEYVAQVIAPIALASIKLSTLSLYRRVFVFDKSNVRDGRNILFCISLGIISLWGLCFFLSTLFACRGPTWEPLFKSVFPPPDQCIDGFKLGWSFALSDFLTDAIVIMVPIPFVCQLHLPLIKKLAIGGMLLFGALATVASLMRMLLKDWAHRVGHDQGLDEGLMVTTGCFWLAIEAQVGLLAACLPTLGGLFRRQKQSAVL